MPKTSKAFQRFAEATARSSGRPLTFLMAVCVIIVWAVTGPLFHFNDTWQLVINTGTTIVTFLMVFLIQNSQNRDSAALQIKLDELIRVTRAHNRVLDLEDVDEEALDRLRHAYRRLAHGRRHDPDGTDGGADNGGTGDGGEGQAAAPPQATDAQREADEIDRELERACAERDEEEAEDNRARELARRSPAVGPAAGG